MIIKRKETLEKLLVNKKYSFANKLNAICFITEYEHFFSLTDDSSNYLTFFYLIFDGGFVFRTPLTKNFKLSII